MTLNVDEMTDEQIEAAQAAEDEAVGNLEVKDEDEKEASESEAPAAVADEAVQTAEAETQPDEQSAEPAKVAGVASKDGTRVLPYAALQAERRAARHERTARERAEAEAAALRQQLEDMKAGKAPAEAPESDELSEAELAEMARDFPPVGKVAKQVKALTETIARLTPKQQAEAQDSAAEPADDPVQEAIDAVPMLLEWQASDPAKFARAQLLDDVAKTSPKWRDKPMAERFAHVAKQVADEFDIPFTDTPRTSKPNAADPKTVISRAARSVPNTLSDFKGGAVDQTEQRIERMPPAKAQARMAQMSDAEIEAHLAKFG